MDNIAPGQTLGPYRIIGQIGQGGMATVYKAYHAAMDRYVAIKVLPRQLADNPEFIGRFQQEARTIAKLEHARILPVYDYGEHEGITYLVMRFLEGGTLKDAMRAGPLPLNEVDRLFTQLAEALDYAHKSGVVHRDLKPSNAMMDAQGDLFLTDFGIAKLLASQSQFTSTGAMMGTPAYMSPEQAQGDKVDQRTDIYSLGIILYEMVTGRVPFEAETPLAVVLKQINAPLPLPSSIKPDLAPGIERVLLKALAKTPDDRFAAVSEFLSAWRRAFSEVETVRAAAPDTVEIKASAPTMLSSSGAAETRVAAPAPTPAAAARKGLPLGWILGGAGALIVVVLIVLAAIVLPRLRNRAAARATATLGATAEATSAPEATGEPPATLPVEEALPTTPPEASQWDWWAAGNVVFNVYVHGDEIYTSGPGSLTVWNRADGNYLRQYTTGDGLPHPYVHAVWVDDDGTLWAATEGGLGRLDPQTQEWILYDTADGLDSDSVTALTRVGDVLIAGTQYSGREGGGLNLFDGQRWESASGFPSADHTDDSIQLGNNVNVILYDSATDAVWVGTTNGLGRYADQTWTRFSTAEGLPDNYIYSLIRGDDGALVVGTAVGAARFDEGAGGFIPVEQGPPYGVYGLAQDALGRYYFSGGGGIWRYDPANADWREFSSSTGDVPVYTTFGAARDADGVLYFGTEGAGLLRYDGNEFTTWSLENTPIQAAHAQIIPAPDGSLWFRGENSVDVDRFDLTSETWSFQPRQIGDSMPLAFDPQGNLWASEYQAGVWVIGNGAETHLGAESGLPSNDIRGVAFDAIDGHFLLATGDAGVIHLDADKNFVEVFNPETAGLLDNEMTALFTTADPPATWVGTRFGVSHLTPDFTWEHFPIGQPFTENLSFISRFAQGADGAIWVGTYGDWVYRYADGQWEHFAGGEAGVGLPSPYINSITLAPDGALWFATEEGAARFDGSAWTTLTMNDGLINNRVLDVYVDANGPIYFATAGGVTRWRP